MVARGFRTALLVTVAASLVVVGTTAAAPASNALASKVSPRVLRDTASGHTARFFVILGATADVSGAARLAGKEAKGRYVYDVLRSFADRSQAPLKTILDRMGARYTSHFMANMLTVTGGRDVVEAMAARPDVSRIEPLVWIRSTLLPTTPPKVEPAVEGPTATEWNITTVKAPAVWQQGDTGQGIVLGNIDTGQQWDHPALKPHYRGWNGTTADHDYNWYDEINPADRAPIDQHGHGTHTAGTMVGWDGGANHIGVAPGAKWMSCRSMDASGTGNPDTYVGCWEFMIAPWDLDKQNPDPSKAPVAVSNSWYCAVPQEGCTQTTLYQVILNAKAAGIVPVFAAGNEGPGCDTVGDVGPPAQYPQSYTVGASTRSNTLASFSSRGPAHLGGQTLIKPNIVAPGDGVRSSYAFPPNSYAVLSGTSMASPHIAGVIALIYQAKPQLIGDVDGTEALINRTATHMNSSACSSSGTFPNNLWGYGLVNALKAVNAP
jgi:subtilisin family serine protease